MDEVFALQAWRGDHRIGDEALVGELAEEARAVRIHRGDLLELTRSLEPGREAVLDARGTVLEPARIGRALAQSKLQKWKEIPYQ